MILKHVPFAMCTRMVEVATQPKKWFYAGERGEGVKQLQWGLIDVGYPLPKSTQKNSGNPDGVYGAETIAAVSNYQSTRPGLSVDGVAGRNTILKLDAELAKTAWVPPPPKPPATPYRLLPRGEKYMLGVKPPHRPKDAGAGKWGAKKTVPGMRTAKDAILVALLYDPGKIHAQTGPTAVKHMIHYFRNTGAPLNVDVFQFLSKVPLARKRYHDEVAQARKFAEHLPIGIHNITSAKIEYSEVPKRQSRDWYYAMNNYQSWGEGWLAITKGPHGKRHYTLGFDYHIFDPYTWDEGKAVKIAGYRIEDWWIGEFHAQGIAKQYVLKGTLRRKLNWTEDGPTQGI